MERESSEKRSSSKSKSKTPRPEEIKTLLRHLLPLLEKEESEVQEMPKVERQEAEGWLDWGIQLVKDYGPMLAKVAPELLALL
jgi:hypothetical protein